MAKILKFSQVDKGVHEGHDINKLFQKYKTNPILGEDPLQFWEKFNESGILEDKLLSEMAVTYLTPPATSIDVERLFSIATQIASDKRNRLNPENAEKFYFCE